MPTGNPNQPSTSLLRAKFGFTDFRPGQADAIGSLFDGQHTLVVMPTGAGKSLVYQYAAVARAGTAVVISPLISLMQDQVNSLTRRKIPAAFINSSIPSVEQSRRLDAMAQGEYRLVYVAPERLRNAAFRNVLLTANVSLLAVDEAHCISQWGHDFRPDYLHIADARRAMGDPLTVALTATATPRVREDIASRLNLEPVRHIVTGFNRPNLTLRVISSRDPEGKMRALVKAITGLKDGAAIVYVGTRRDTEEIAEFISEATGRHAGCYHGGLPPEDRTRVQDDFMSGRLSVVTATSAFGMGIDRADVRMVLHYTVPSSLEEYYQEAGRAGRDGRPALAALLYSPQDRSLQEYFIDNSEISLDDLSALYDEVKTASNGITSDDLSLALGLNDTAIRVGLSQLETSGIVRILSTEGLRWFIKANEWSQGEALAAVGRASEHLAAKREQLERMIDYAESNSCRRRILLDHFGDPGPADAPRCCDNCFAKRGLVPVSSHVSPDGAAAGVRAGSEREGEDEPTKTARAILDAVRLIQWGIGVGKLTKLLAGSTAKSIGLASYKHNPYFGRLSGFGQEVIGGLIEQLIDLGYVKPVGGRLPVLKLSPHGESALESESVILLKLPEPVRSREPRRRSERTTEATIEITSRMLADGLDVAQIAERRGLAVVTIHSHLAQLIAVGRADLSRAVAPEVAAQIRDVISQVGEGFRLSPVKALLPDSVSYEQIRCVMAADGLLPPPGLRPAPHDAKPVTEPGKDVVADYLSKSHPKPLPGPWTSGWSLGFHSSFAGSDWSRSGVGQLAYQLKYRADENALTPLVREAMEVCRKNPELADVDAIVPVPPSMKRRFDPVSAFGEALAHELRVEMWPAVEKTRSTRPQKELRTLARKRANVRGAFAVRGEVKGTKLLLVDDLFDSGATLEEVHRVLRAAGATSVCILTLTRTIHSDS